MGFSLPTILLIIIMIIIYCSIGYRAHPGGFGRLVEVDHLEFEFGIFVTCKNRVSGGDGVDSMAAVAL